MQTQEQIAAQIALAEGLDGVDGIESHYDSLPVTIQHPDTETTSFRVIIAVTPGTELEIELRADGTYSVTANGG